MSLGLGDEGATAAWRRLRGLWRAPWLVPLLLLTPFLVALAAGAVRLAVHKNFAIDEFQYAHAAWLVARGQVPYRDFFEVHFPLTYQLLSLLWLGVDDDPRHVLRLRAGMLVLLALTTAAVWQLCRRHGRVLGLVGPVLLLSCLPFVQFATEIRNDPTAFAFYAAALAVLTVDGISERRRGLWAGVLLALSCWGTQKALLYGSPFVAAWLADVTVHRRRRCGYLLGDPGRFLAGASCVVLPVALTLLLSGSAGAWWRWCFVWAAEYQQRYAGFSWGKGFAGYLLDHWWHLPLAGLGVYEAARRMARQGPGSRPDPDHLLLGSLLTTFLSVTLQQAPWGYSWLPFLGLLIVLAARGLIAVVAGARRLEGRTGVAGAYLVLTLVISLAFVLQRAREKIAARVEANDNAYQLEVLGQIARLTAPDDAAYDNSGSYVSRPHAYFHYYTDASTRTHDAAMLVSEVPRAIEGSQAVLVLRDARSGGLPPALNQYLERHFLPYSGDLWLWGSTLSGAGPADFSAVKPGAYFISPPTAAAGGAIRIDGAPVPQTPFPLAAGSHRVEWSTAQPFSILWLPRDDRPWSPAVGAKPRFSTIF